ncbi:Flavin amine oxidase [Fusarium oxysporum f. sp. vasinfectum]|nr:Flavin amine oxidase [Fusarium oxysporum f. sp. vasinfectum]
MAQNFQVVIVGAGLSGLRAAREVHNAGLSHIVLEAMDRVGGKTLSVQASDGNGVVDLGASWINDTSQSEIYKLAKEFGFDLVEQRTEGNSLYRDEMGQVHCIPFEMPAKLEPEQLKEVEQFMQILSDYAERCDTDDPSNVPDAKYLDSMTVAEFIAGFKDPSASALVNNITRSLLGVESDEPSALFFLDILKRGTGLKNVISDFKDGAQYLRNRQGNQAFCDRLAAGLNAGSVKISSAVKAITQKEGKGCFVETINGDVYRADRVIVSVPTPLYPLIHFEPSLPPAKKKLADSAKSGYYTKTILVYAEPWWHSAGLSGVYSSTDGPVVFTHDTCIPQDGQYSITCFHAGDPGRKWSRLPAEERKQVVLQDICTAFGTVVDNIPEPINVIEKDWTKDPWAQGGPGPVWRPGFLADGECDVEGACEPINRYEEGLYLPICIGEVIAGRYRIEHKLGHGGFSTVWMAYDMHKGKDVALKIMTADPGGEREFLRQNEIISCVPDTSRLFIYQDTFLLPGAARNPHRVLVFPLKGPNLRDYTRETSTIVRRSAAKQLLQALKALHDGGMVHRDLNSANVMFGLSSFETGADLTTKYQILGRPQKIELPRDQETWKDGELVAPMTPKDSFVVQDTITLGDFGLAIRSGTEVDFKLQINPTFASDMWSYMCIFAELYLKWPLFGPGFFGGGFRFVAELFVRVLGPLPLSWKGSYDGDGEPDESWYDQSKIPEPKMSLESRVTQSRDTVEPAEQQLVLSILRRGFSYLPEERLSAGELLEDASFKALMDRYGV